MTTLDTYDTLPLGLTTTRPFGLTTTRPLGLATTGICGGESTLTGLTRGYLTCMAFV